jgi:ATP-dependent DNA ligase
MSQAGLHEVKYDGYRMMLTREQDRGDRTYPPAHRH